MVLTANGYTFEGTIGANNSTLTRQQQPLGGSISIRGTTQWGETLTVNTASVTPDGAAETLSYTWYRCTSSDGSDGAEIENANTGTYTLTGDDAGKYIKVEVTSTEYSGTLSAVTSQVQKAAATVSDAPAAIKDLVYTGSAQELVTAGATSDGTMQYSQTKDGEYSATVPTGTNAGEYTVYYYVKGDDNHSDTEPVEIKVTISQASIANATVSLSQDTFTYTGSEQKPTVTVKLGEKTLNANDYDVTYSGNYTDAGTYTVTVTGKGNYSGTASSKPTYTITKANQAALSITSSGPVTFGQDYTLTTSGGSGSGAVTFTVTNGTGKATVSDNILTPIKTGTVTVTAVKDGDNNYNDVTSETITITINKGNYDGTKTASGTVLANWSGEVTLPAIPDGASYGTPTYTGSDGAVTGLTITGIKLSYTGGSGIEKDVQYTVTVPVTGATNYVNYNITVTLTGTNKTPLTISGVTAQDGTYNGQQQAGYTGTPSAEGYTGNFTVTYNTTDGKAPTNAGNYTVTIAIPDSDPQYVGSTDLQFTIAKKPLIVSVSSFSIRVGDNAPELALTYTGLVDGESVTPSDTPTFTITKDSTVIDLADAVKTAGTYTITWSNADKGFTGGENYDIQTVTTGTLKVSNRPVTPAPTPSGPSTGGSDGWTEIEDEVTETPSGSTVTVTMNTSDIPVDVINAVTGDKEAVQLSLAHNGEFGFTLTLTAPVGVQNKGMWANLYHYDTTLKQMLFETSAQVDASGNVALKFTHASEYAIVLDESSHELPFTDVGKKSWYTAAVQYVYQNGIMAGTGATAFAPDATLSRGMVAQILYNLEGLPDVTGESTFTDVSGHWAIDAITWAQQTGVVDGYENNTFRPDKAVTREELAQMLYNYAEYKDYDLSAQGDLTAFPDGSKVSDWAETALSWANGNQLINGFEDDTLRPGGNSTRAQAASILMNFDVNLAK